MVATKQHITQFCLSLITITTLVISAVQAAVLPEDRADILYHRYEGGGSIIDGPSVLVRKEFADKVSVWGNYYVDMLSSASIDVVTAGSPDGYTEQRVETSAGIDYLHDRTLMSASFTSSNEDDYEASTFGLGLSQEFFGDLTTLAINYSQGNDVVKQNIYEDGRVTQTDTQGKARHQRFGIGLTQILTKKLIVSANAESVIDDGFLNNPYRSVRFRQTVNGVEGVGTQEEVYPTTRNSDAFAIRSMYYLPYRAALRLEWRYYQDSWKIRSRNAEVRYIHPLGNRWTLEARYRTYSQTQAQFYSDLFDRADIFDVYARDKELSSYSNFTFGFGVSYEVQRTLYNWIDKLTLNAQVDHMEFSYDNFRDISGTNTQDFGLGNEPLYAFDANILRFFISIWY